MGIIGTFVQYLKNTGASQGTICQRRDGLLRLQKALERELLELDSETLTAFINGHPQWSENYRRNTLATIRVFYKWAHEKGFINKNPALEIITPKFKKRPPLPPIDEKSLIKAINAATSIRDLSALLLAGTMGLRRGEIAKLPLAAHVGQTIRVVGKGGKVRVLTLDEVTHNILIKRADEVRGYSEFFYPGDVDGHVCGYTIYKWIKRYVGDWAPHSLRRRSATKSFTGTKDIRAVQEFLGHANVSTTMDYVEASAEQVAACANAASFINLKSVRNIAGLPEELRPDAEKQLSFIELLARVTEMARTEGLEVRLKQAA